MTVQTDPLDYCIVDENENLQHSLPLPEASNGFANLQELPADKFNTIARTASVWNRYHDQGKAPVEQTLGLTSCRLSDEVFEYTVVPGLDQSLVDDTAYLILGRYVPLTADRITASGQTDILTHTFGANSDTHFYLFADGTVTYEEVAVATPPSAPANSVWLHTVTTNGTDVLSQTTGTLFEQVQVRASRPWVHEDVLAIDKDAIGFGSLDFWSDGDPDLGWRVDCTGGDALALYEKNGLEAQIVNFGNVSDPITLNRGLLVYGDTQIDANLNLSNTRTYTAGNALYLRTHDPASGTESTFHVLYHTVAKTAAAENAAHTLDTDTLEDGVYCGHISVLVVTVGSNAVNAFKRFTVGYYVISGVSASFYSAVEHTTDSIGLTSINHSATAGKIRVTVTIPNLAGTPTFNIFVFHHLSYLNNG